jgi:polyphosphate kinase
MAIDQSHPFPLLNNKSLNLIAEIEVEGGDACSYAVVQVPTVVPRVVELPASERFAEKREFMLLEVIIGEFIDKLFTGYKVIDSSVFRITRNTDVEIDEEDAEDLLNEMEKTIKRRKWGEPVRLEVSRSMSQRSKKFLKKSFGLDAENIYEQVGVLDPTVWMSFYSFKGFERLKDKPLPPVPSADFAGRNDCFEVIREKDVLVHHPYDSFDCVVDFVQSAATDPQVLAIKQTLYRVSGNSPIVNALISAAENGKQVTVLVELKARFDEENNIIWARKLEQSGCHVVYGLVGLKTHCKICLVVRKEEDGIRRYVHLGTGNYNDSTARLYTDIGLFTCKETFGQDVSALFNVLTGYSVNTGWNKISVAPVSLREAFLTHIHNETQNAKDGKEAAIVAKMNSLVDIEVIRALYAASAAGVRIKLLVRGICCLKAGIEGVSENITVMSIVGRFLEHSRIFYFENGGSPRLFLSSADWMPRNLDRRVEVAFPVEKAELKEKLVEILDLSMSDTIKLRIQRPDGSYEKVDKRGKEHINSQLRFHELAAGRIGTAKKEEDVFKPIFHSL